MLIDEIKKENILALKEKNNNKRSVLSVIINKYMIAGYEAKAKNIELTDDDLIKIIIKQSKELEEEKESYLKASREEKVKEIEEQISYIEKYIPKLLNEEEIRKIIEGLEDKSIPNIMKYFKTNYNNKVDMALVNRIAKSL